jgi:hypothetical protein
MVWDNFFYFDVWLLSTSKIFPSGKVRKAFIAMFAEGR